MECKHLKLLFRRLHASQNDPLSDNRYQRSKCI
jgi:hypothetical protein